MNQHRLRNSLGFGMTAVIVSCVFATAVSGQASTDQETAPQVVDSLDEITVYGKKSLHLLREDVIEAELNVFGIYNELNSSDDFDIHCFERARTGTRIKQRFCLPNFARNVSSNSRQFAFIKSEDASGPYIPDWAGVNKQQRQLEEEMEALAKQHPELIDALVEYATTKHILATEKTNSCKGKGIICEK